MRTKIRSLLTRLDNAVPDETTFVVSRNESFLDSIKLGVGMNLLYAPSSLFRATAESLGTFLVSALGVILSLIGWAGTVLLLLVLAPFGMVTRPEDDHKNDGPGGGASPA